MIKIKIYNVISNNYCAFINDECIKSNSNVICIDPKPGIYKIRVFDQTQIVLYNKSNITLPFCFNFNNKNNVRVIHLTDRYYEGLKIEKGEIILNGI